MDLDEAVGLLAGTSVIPAGSRLREALGTVLGELARRGAVEQRARDVLDPARWLEVPHSVETQGAVRYIVEGL